MTDKQISKRKQSQTAALVQTFGALAAVLDCSEEHLQEGVGLITSILDAADPEAVNQVFRQIEAYILQTRIDL